MADTQTPLDMSAKTSQDGGDLKKPELIDRVVALSGMKKKDVKPVVEATLAVIGQALSDGEELNLQPFGKARVVKQKDLPNGQALTMKLRRSGPAIKETEPLAQESTEGLAKDD